MTVNLYYRRETKYKTNFEIDNVEELNKVFKKMPIYTYFIDYRHDPDKITIIDFPDLSEFTNITVIKIPKCGITKLPKLPYTLIEFDCSFNKIKILKYKDLPEGLEKLDCLYMNLEKIEHLPKSLKYLDCSYNNLSEIPLLPQSLKKFFCCYNINISILPDYIAEINLEQLYIIGLNLTNISKLSKTLIHFSCSENKLCKLPTLPENLLSLYCNDNYFTVLPELPENLLVLYCNDNYFTVLPELPRNLLSLSFKNNYLTEIPLLPNSLRYLYCNNNFISKINLTEFVRNSNHFVFIYKDICIQKNPLNFLPKTIPKFWKK